MANPTDAPNNALPPSPFLSNEEAARFLKLSPRTLEKLRVVGGGPQFRKLGRRVMYTIEELNAWARLRRCDSTSDPAWKTPPRNC
jgi:molybdenum cofactor biosynthesis enzyme MoaA